MDNVNNIPETLQNVFQNVKHKGHGGHNKACYFHSLFIDSHMASSGNNEKGKKVTQ